jgi:hypothetical protein
MLTIEQNIKKCVNKDIFRRELSVVYWLFMLWQRKQAWNQMPTYLLGRDQYQPFLAIALYCA